MTSQGEEGWPLGLPPITLRMRLVEAFAAAGAGDAGTSFVLNATPSFSSLSSSDLDTESTGSFFPDKTITLGSLIGIAGASAANASFRRTLGTMDDASNMAAGPRRFINRLTWRRSDASGPSTNKLTSSWSNLIRCGSCRGSYDYPDDKSTIGAPPSLGHFLDEERELDSISNNQAKVYINVMFEEDMPSSRITDAINPLFDSGHVSSPSVINLLNNSLSNSVPVVNNVVLPAHSIAEKANELQEQMSRRSFNHSKKHQFMEQNNDFHRMQAEAKSIEPLQKAETSSKSRSQRNQSNTGGVCMLGCVSHIWGFPKNTADTKDNQSEIFEDVDLHCSSDESTCESHLESPTPSDRKMSCYTNYSFDDSDCSIYFDDEEDLYLSDSKVQTTTASCDMEEFQFCSLGIQSGDIVPMKAKKIPSLEQRNSPRLMT